MRKRKPIETEKQLLNALEEFFCDVAEDEPVEIIDAELRELGYNPEALGRRMGEMARRALTDSPLNWRTQGRREIEAAKERLSRFENLPITQGPDRPALVNAIQQLLRKLGYSDPQLVPAHFRNFETASDQDLASLLRQLEYLASNQDSRED